MRGRVAAGLPAARQLSDRPALDALLRETGSDLSWEAEADSYVAPPLSRPTGATSYASSVERLATAAVPRLAPRTDP